MCGCSKVLLSYSDLCHMEFVWYRNGWTLIWWKRLTILHSVNTDIERKMKAFESRFVWVLKTFSVLKHPDLKALEPRLVWMLKRPSVLETFQCRQGRQGRHRQGRCLVQAQSVSITEQARSAIGSASVAREQRQMRKRPLGHSDL